MTGRSKKQGFVLVLDVCVPWHARLSHGFTADTIPDGIYGAVQRMINRHYLREPVAQPVMSTNCYGNYVIYVEWGTDTYDEAATAQLWDRLVDAVEFRIYY